MSYIKAGKLQSFALSSGESAPNLYETLSLLNTDLKTQFTWAFIGIALLLLVGLSTQSALAQNTTTESIPGGDAFLSSGTQVKLITIGPGQLVWERFGHNGLWIHDEARGIDEVFHWGLFDFQSDNFWPKFLNGYMDYSIGRIDSAAFLEFNMRADRNIWVQEINLSPAQKNELFALLLENTRTQNRIYRYNYYLDNCSTRARDMIDRVLGGAIKAQSTEVASGKSFRSNTARLLQPMLLPYLGIQLGLGQPADEGISVWKDMFTPMSLRRYLNQMSLADGSKLILSDKFVYSSSGISEPKDQPSFFWFYLPISASIGLLFAMLSYLVLAGKTAARVIFALLGFLWSLLSGLLGTVLILVWFFTEHRFGHWNENLLQFNPLFLFVSLFFAFVLLKKPIPKYGMLVLNIVTALSILGVLLQVLPGFAQVNAEIIALALPANLGLCFALHTIQKTIPQGRFSRRY